MNISILIIFIIVFPLCSMLYVYKYRGNARFSSVVEYLRKGWPIFAPLNVLLYLSSKKHIRKPFVDVDEFKQLALLEKNWQVIAKEAENLVELGFFEATVTQENKSYYDVGFRTFYKYGWSKFYCTWYGTSLNSALKYCPKTVSLLKQIPSINGAMFTVLAPQSKLTRHLDPAACSLRYHLGLNTPNSENCFIDVDNEKQSWQDGKAFVFDETYLHYVENNTDKTRLILMCDIDRPMNVFGRVVNWGYKKMISQMVVPNLPEDQAGIVNKLFSKVTPFLTKSKQLKKQSPKVYYPTKWAFNTLLLAVLALLLMGIMSMLSDFVHIIT